MSMIFFFFLPEMWTHRTKSYFPLGVSPSQMSSAPQKSAVDFSPGSSYKARSPPAGAGPSALQVGSQANYSYFLYRSQSNCHC